VRRRDRVGSSRFGSVSAAGRDVGPVDPFGFSWPRPFRCEAPADVCWLVLDFLGFSRANRDFSMGYEARSGEIFFSRFFPSNSQRHDGSLRSWHAEGQDCSWGKLTSFLIFCERLPSEILQKRGRLILYGWRRIAEKRSCQRSAFSRWR
jgi:hypothetical protein